MPQDLTDSQVAQTERVGVMVTPEEKRAVRFVSDARGLTESALMRDLPIGEIVAEYDRICAVINNLEPSAA